MILNILFKDVALSRKKGEQMFIKAQLNTYGDVNLNKIFVEIKESLPEPFFFLSKSVFMVLPNLISRYYIL